MELADSAESVLKDVETGKTTTHVHYVRRDGDRVAKSTTTVDERSVRYFVDGWPTEDIMAFFERVISDLADLVERAYKAFPKKADFSA